MRQLTESNLTEAVLATFKDCEDERFKQIMSAFVKHLHEFIRDIEPSEEEWFQAIQFLLSTAAISDDKRNEFILFSDTVGASMLVDFISHRKLSGGTESSVLGPFYVEGAPEYPNGADLRGDLSQGEQGDTVVVSGVVQGEDGNPLANALLDIWETAPDGFYHMQKSGQVPEFELAGKLRTDERGRYQFCTYKPVSYSIPTDGPVGKVLLKLGRHTFRPAHIHMIVSAEEFDPVVTQLFTEGDEYLDSDVVFGVKDSLVVSYESVEGGDLAQQYSIKGRYWTIDYDFVLERSQVLA